MSDYLLIESRDPFSGDESFAELARGLAAAGNKVTFFLVENGVLAARTGALASLSKAGVELLADGFALQERGITSPTIPAAGLEVVVDQLAAGRKTLWH